MKRSYEAYWADQIIVKLFYIQGYPERMRLQKRLYIIYTVYYLIFSILCSFKLVSFFVMSINRPIKDNIQDKRLNLFLQSSYFMSFRSTLKSHPYLEITILFWNVPILSLFTRCYKILNTSHSYPPANQTFLNP